MLNKCMQIVRLGKDPEIKTSSTGTKIANFTGALNAPGKEGTTKTLWYSYTAFGPKAEYAEKWLKKGMQVYIESRPEPDSYTDQNQQKQYVTKYIVQDIMKVGNSGEGAPSAQATPTTPKTEAVETEAVADTDTSALPFDVGAFDF